MFCHGEYLRWNIGTVIAENHRQFAIVALRNLVRECKFKILDRSHIVFVSLLANHVKKNEPYVNRGSANMKALHATGVHDYRFDRPRILFGTMTRNNEPCNRTTPRVSV